MRTPAADEPAPTFPLLAAPVRFGPIELRNRVVLLPHGVYFADLDAQRATRRHVDYYARRAAGGVGLAIMESSVVSADGRGRGALTFSGSPGSVHGYRQIAQAVHREGARVAGQITHFGNQAISALTRQPLLAPSSVGDPLLREQARAMTRDDLARVRDAFAAATRNFVRAGFDAVEVKLAHDGLLRQFMSPLANDRRDAYGGSTENRLRFPLEVLEAVRTAAGSSVAIGARLVVDERLPGGYALDEGLRFAGLLGTSGLVDYISSDVGVSASIHWVIPPMAVPEGYAEEAFAGITKASALPVIACGQISSPFYAERLLEEGKAAAIGMARQLLADPDWCSKAFAGFPSRIRPCTRCNQLCVRNSVAFVPTGCTLNPLAGHGERLPQRRREAGRRRVTVVGGGPAGLEAARIAAERGHRIQLFEASDHVGGRLALAARTGRRTGWRPYLDWLERETTRLGVAVETRCRATVADVLGTAPDHVIVATGSVAEPAAGALDLDAYVESERVEESVVLADLGVAGMELWSAALEAAYRGARVTVVTPLPTPGADVDGPTFLWLREELARLHVRVLTEHTIVELGDTSLTAGELFTREQVRVEGALVVGSAPRRGTGGALAGALRRRVPVTVVGDAVVPRDASAAIREGQEAALAVETSAPAAAHASTHSRS